MTISDQTNGQQAAITAARESFSGKTLTEGQFREAWAISGVIHGKIQETGSFRDPLTDYAHAFARAQKFDALRGETIVRDVYGGRYGQSMNQTREALMQAEENLAPHAKTRALDHAESIGPMIREGETRPFYQAYDAAAVTLAGELGITQSGAKTLMKETFQEHHGRDLYEAGKEIEAAYHKPIREAEIAHRKAEKLQTRTHSQTRG